MSRRRAAEKRNVIPDHKFKDIVLTKFMNRIMIDGKKSASEKIVYGAFDILSKKTDKSPIDFFHDALNNVKPSLEVRSRRVGGATYQVPMEVRPRRAQTLAMKWIVDSAIKRNEKYNYFPFVSGDLIEKHRATLGAQLKNDLQSYLDYSKNNSGKQNGRNLS